MNNGRKHNFICKQADGRRLDAAWPWFYSEQFGHCQGWRIWHLNPTLKLMDKPKIVAYLKPTCGWSQGVRAVLRKYDLPFEDRDIINDPLQRQEMIEKSGQMLSPCVEINGKMLADISGEEVEMWMLSNN